MIFLSDEDVIVRCQRCGDVDARAHQGWRLLCVGCINAEMSEMFDD